MLSIHEIKMQLKDMPAEKLPMALEALAGDGREGVQKLVLQYQKRREAHLAEMARLMNMLTYEDKYYGYGYRFVCGTDEVGRGPLAGPVCAAAVILPRGFMLEGLNDSKKLSEAKRERLNEAILEKAEAYAVAMISVKEIDETNILAASLKAMKQAVEQLEVQADVALVDGVHRPDIDMKSVPIVGGDGKSASIAAASIVAKVARDRLLYEYDKIYPEYGFAKNKGYGTAEHIKAIGEHGITPLHRRTFINPAWEV